VWLGVAASMEIYRDEETDMLFVGPNNTAEKETVVKKQ
jgi:hypothetical protein